VGYDAPRWGMAFALAERIHESTLSSGTAGWSWRSSCESLSRSVVDPGWSRESEEVRKLAW